MFDKHTYSAAFPGPVQIMRQTIPNSDMGISPFAQYHTNKGLSSIPNLAGNRKDIPDTKQSYIDKHSYEDMMDIRFGDIKVWI